MSSGSDKGRDECSALLLSHWLRDGGRMLHGGLHW